MQSAKSAAASVKETAANVAASAKAGADKARATVQEKVEKIGAHDPIQKDMATHKKEEKIHVAEQNKQEARNHNAAARHLAADTTGDRHVTASSGFTTPDYLTGSDISGPIPAHDTNVEYPSIGTGLNLAHNISPLGPNSPTRGPSNVDAVYPDDIGSGLNQTHNAQGGGPTSGFGTGGLIN